MSLFNQDIVDQPTTTFYIVRHGQTDWNVQKKIQGHTDIPLNETGHMESKRLAAELTGTTFDVAYSSDLKRAYETSLIIKNNHALDVFKDKRLRERHFGKWEGRYFSELDALTNEDKSDVETDEAMIQRAFEFLNEAVHVNRGKTILIVTHGGLMRSILVKAMSLTFTVEGFSTLNNSIIVLSHENGEWTVKKLQGIILP